MRIFFILTGLFLSLPLVAQDCPLINPPVNSGCGDPPLVSYEADGVASFCESQEVVFKNTTYGPIGFYDYFVINWGDSSPLDTIYSYDDVSHVFDFSNLDRCMEGPVISREYCYVGVKQCGDGITSHVQSGYFSVKLKPVARFSFEPVICAGKTILFRQESCNQSTYAWDFNEDGIIDSTDPDPSYTFLSAGSRQITLEVTNACGTDKITRTIEVVEEPEAQIELGLTGGELCSPGLKEITFTHNEWVFGPSGKFEWEVTPAYTNQSGAWCFVASEDGAVPVCLPDSVLSESALDSLLQVEKLNLYFRAAGDYEVTLAYENVCVAQTATETIAVFAPPELSPMEDKSGCDEVEVCFADLGLTIDGDYASVQWIFENGSSAGSATLDFGCVTFQQNGRLIINVSGEGACANVSDTVNVRVFNTQGVTVADPTPNVICQNAGLIPLSPSVQGGSYLYNGIPADFIQNNSLDPSDLSPGTYTITYVLSDNPECPAEADFGFTIQEGPSITLGDNSPVCESVLDFNPRIISASGDIDAWNWQIVSSTGMVTAESNTQNPDFAIDVPDNYQIVVSLNSNECGNVRDTSTLWIQANQQAVIEPFASPYCQGASPFSLTGTPLGGVWSGTGIIDQEAGLFDPSGVAPGRYSITYTIENGVCRASTSEWIEVVASESLEVRDTFFCITDAPALLAASPAGGVFTGSGIIDSLTGLFDPGLVNAGSNLIGYTFIDRNACVVTEDLRVEVDAIPVLSFQDTLTICIGDEKVSVPELLVLDTGGAVGSLSYAGTGIVDSEAGLFSSANLATGFYTVWIDFATRSCSVQDSLVIELVEKPDLTLSEDLTVCVSDGSLSLDANIPGGEWTSANCVIDPLTGTIDLIASGELDCIFQYEINAGTSCAQSGTVNVTILDLSDDLQVPDPVGICYTTGTYTIPGFVPADGNWAGPGLVDEKKGIIDVGGLSPGNTYEYTYCITAPDIDCEACQTFELMIEPLPVADFTLAGAPCQEQSFAVINSSLNGASYSWDFGQGPIDAFAPEHTYTSAGLQTITLIATTDFGCQDTLRKSIQVTAPPVLDLTIATREGCAPLAIDYTNQSGGEGAIQYWIIDGVDTLLGAQPEIILDSVFTDSLITLELVVWNDCERLSQSTEILVHPYPIVDFGINDDEGCSPDTVFFSNTTRGAPETFLWDFGIPGRTDTVWQPLPQVFISPDDSISIYTISLYASNACGEGRLEKQIQVYPNNVDAFFELDTLSGCPPFTVSVKNYATPGARVTYDFGDGTTANTPDATHTYTRPGKYLITQYASLCGTDFVRSDTITVFPLADLAFVAPTYACLGDTVFFQNNSTNGVVSTWLFGDGSTSSERSPRHVYTRPGNYEVSLVMNSIFNDCPDTLTQSIFIPEPPVAQFTPSQTAVCPGEAVFFEHESIDAIDFAWNFGDGLSSAMPSPVHVYQDSGVYEVRLTVFDQYGCSADTSLINLLVHPAPRSRFAISAEEICQFHDTLTLTNQSTGFLSSTWQVNGGAPADQGNDMELSFDTFGDQTVTLVVSNAFGCMDTSSVSIQVLPAPVARAVVDEQVVCEGLSLDFSSTSVNANLIQWHFDGNNTSTDQMATHRFGVAGDYRVELIAANTNGCPNDTLFIPIEVFPGAIAQFSVAPFDTCVIPLEVALINSSAYSTDFSWDLGNGGRSSLFAPTAWYYEPGTYAITLIASNAYNCPDTTQQNITIYGPAKAEFQVPITEVCEGDTIDLINSSAGADQFVWLVDGEPANGFPLVFTAPGAYRLSLMASNAGVCFDTATLGTAVRVYDAPKAGFAAVIDESPSIIGDARFVNTSTNANTYFWDFDDGSTSEEQNPAHEYDENGPMTVTLNAYNTNAGQFTCVSQVRQRINYEPIYTFYVPNAISPDQNYGNDEVGLFLPKGIGIATYELNIYSPWGDKVATLNRVFAGSPADAWDGTFNGSPVPQGAYLWTARIQYINGHADYKKGSVTVIR